MACNLQVLDYFALWRWTYIAAIARNAKALTPKTPAPASLKRDGAAGKSAVCLIHVSGTLGGKI